MNLTARTLFTLLFSFMLSQSSIADESITTPSPWKNNVELGAIKTSGNTHTTTVNAKAKSVYESEAWRTTVIGDAVSSSSNNATTSEKYNASIQEDWKMDSRNYIFLRGAFESDRFSGFKRRISETAGYGRQLIKTTNFEWKGEIGGGLRQSRLTNNTSTSEGIVRSATDVDWQFSEASKLTQDLSTEGGKKGWTSNSTTALQTKLNSHLASKIALSFKHNSKVPTGTKKLDTETAITLVLNF